jgi:hypothetical protein
MPVIIDRNVYPVPTAPSLPAAGGVFPDPTFGTRIVRVTDPNNGTYANHAYATWRALNANSTLILLATSAGPILIPFDPAVLMFSSPIPIFTAAPEPGGPLARWEDAEWSENPSVLYCHAGAKIFAFDVISHTFLLIADLSSRAAYINRMSMSDDGQVFAYTKYGHNSQPFGFGVYSRQAGKEIIGEGVSSYYKVQIDKTGRFLQNVLQAAGKGVVNVIEYDLKTGMQTDLVDSDPDYSPGHCDLGRGTVIGYDNYRNRLLKRELVIPKQFTTVHDFGNDWGQESHFSLRANDESWILVSYGGNTPRQTHGRFHEEIFLLKTDGSGEVRRLCHHQSYAKNNDYWDFPRACLSRDGRFVVFTSRWGGGRRDVFLLEIPQQWQPQPPAPPSQQPPATPPLPQPFKFEERYSFDATQDFVIKGGLEPKKQ